jgi:hypothetical protein
LTFRGIVLALRDAAVDSLKRGVAPAESVRRPSGRGKAKCEGD